MGNYFVDSTTGNNGDNGTTMDLAWADLDYALSNGGLSAGDIVWVRRIHSEIPTSSIFMAYDGTAGSPIRVIGWPRPAIPNTTITGADWTNGSELVDNVAGITPDREKHIARRCVAPDGKVYLITAILWEFTVDGMGSGDEFAVGEILTNTTQTKKGKVFGFTDNLDTTGTIQAVVDSSSAWVNNDNITSNGGGDAELSANAVAVGFLIDRKYPGSTVSGVNGKFQIEADDDWYDDMGAQYGFDDSGWTIKESNWDADAIDLPVIDFNDADLNFSISSDHYNILANLEIKDSTDVDGIIYINNGSSHSLIGCLIKQTTQNDPLLVPLSGPNLLVERCVFEGSGSGVSQRGMFAKQGARPRFKDCALYNLGGPPIYVPTSAAGARLENVNLGHEMENAGNEIVITGAGKVTGVDVILGGSDYFIYFATGVTTTNSSGRQSRISIGNFQKVLGKHVTFFPGGKTGPTGGFSNVDVGDTDAPSAASPAGSTSDLIAVYPNVSGHEFIPEWAVRICKWKIWAAAAAETYTVYIQNNMGVTLNDVTAKDDIWLKLTYINVYAEASEYNKKELFSTEIDIAQRSSQTDWDSLTIASHTPAVAGWAVLELFVSKRVSSGQIYIDPLWV